MIINSQSVCACVPPQEAVHAGDGGVLQRDIALALPPYADLPTFPQLDYIHRLFLPSTRRYYRILVEALVLEARQHLLQREQFLADLANHPLPPRSKYSLANLHVPASLHHPHAQAAHMYELRGALALADGEELVVGGEGLAEAVAASRGILQG